MELIRIFKNKKFIAAVITLLLLNCVSFYITQQKSLSDFGINIDTYSATFKDNADIFTEVDKKSIIEKSNKFEILKSFADNSEDKAQQIKEYPDLYQEYKNSNYSYEELAAQAEFYSHFAYQLEYQNDYPAYIKSILKNAQNLSSKKLFSNKTSYSYKSIQKSANDFSKNKNIKLSLVNDLPVSAVLNYQIGDFILILICVFMAISFVSEKNVNLLINTCKNGRRILKMKQLPILILFSLFFSFAIYISEMLISLKIYDAPMNLYALIQSTDIFSDCILHINFLQLFAIHILFKAIIASMIALAIWLFISLSSNIILVSAIAGVITSIELLLYKNISAQSNLSILKTFNIFSLFDYRSISEYNLVSVFSKPVRAEKAVWIIVLLVIFIISALILISANRNYPIKSPKKAFRVLHVLFDKLSEFYAKLQSVIYAGRFETFKIMHIGKGLLVVIAFLLIIGFNFNTNPLVFSSTEAFLNDYYEEYGGELSEKVYKNIEKMRSEADAVESEYNFKSEQYASGEISLEEYELAAAKNEAYDTQRKAVDKLTEQIDRIESLSQKGIKPVLVNELGYNNLFYSQSNQTQILILICAVVILFSSVFSIEKGSNMLILNHCSKNGRKQLYFKKIFTVIPKTFILTLVSYLSLILQNNYLYKLGNMNANIHNLECLQEINLNLSIAEYIILNFIFEFIFVTVVGLIITSLSAFMPQLAVIIISACLFILPSALYMIDIYSAKEISTSYLLNFNALILDKGISIGSFIMHYALIVFCIVMLVLSNRKWCLTKER
ncbi:MAG: hypothetical protein KBH18_01550 [Eubacterium sp.]|nr:hypothetical protein [Eubacterium sp.]